MSDSLVNHLLSEPCWNYLPDPVLTKLFCYLSLNDRSHASIVCRSWSRAFHFPVLWQCVNIRFDGFRKGISFSGSGDQKKGLALFFSNHKALIFAEKFGRHVKYLHISCDPLHISQNNDVRRKLFQIFKKLSLNGCRLKELTIGNRLCETHWDLFMKKILISYLNEFLRSQKKLEMFKFSSFLDEEDLCLLENLVATNGTTLKSLYFLFYGDGRTNIQETYRCALGKLPSLQYLHLSLESLDRSVLLTLVENCKELKNISIWDMSRIVPSHDILEADWKRACQLHPQLNVSFKTDFWVSSYTQVKALLAPTMPLESLVLVFYDDPLPEPDWNISKVLSYITVNFCRTLVTFSIWNSPFLQTVDNALKKLVTSCSKLRELEIEINVSVDTIEEIWLMQIDNKIDLHLFSIFARRYPKEHIEKLEVIFANYQDKIKDRKWELKV